MEPGLGAPRHHTAVQVLIRGFAKLLRSNRIWQPSLVHLLLLVSLRKLCQHSGSTIEKSFLRNPEIESGVRQWQSAHLLN